MKSLAVIYVLFVAGAFTGFATPCRSAWKARRAARFEATMRPIDRVVTSGRRPSRPARAVSRPRSMTTRRRRPAGRP